MLIFTGGWKSLKHWLTISARGHLHAFIHTRAFPLEQWSATYGTPGRKGTAADLERHAAGPVPFSTEVICHPSAGSQDFASCKARCPQTHLSPRLNPSAKRKPLPLLETRCRSAEWRGDSWLLVWSWSSLGPGRCTLQTHLTSAWNRGKKWCIALETFSCFNVPLCVCSTSTEQIHSWHAPVSATRFIELYW